VKSFEQTTPGEIGMGTRFIGQVRLVGRVSVEIVGYDRPHLIVHRAAAAWPRSVMSGSFTQLLEGPASTSMPSCHQDGGDGARAAHAPYRAAEHARLRSVVAPRVSGEAPVH
jgi:hypothetical protein